MDCFSLEKNLLTTTTPKEFWVASKKYAQKCFDDVRDYIPCFEVRVVKELEDMFNMIDEPGKMLLNKGAREMFVVFGSDEVGDPIFISRGFPSKVVQHLLHV